MIAVYTDQEDVIRQMQLSWVVFLIFVFFDTTQCIGGAMISASGNQTYGAIVTGAGYWALGIPVTCLLVFWKDLGIRGIWIGPTLSVMSSTTAYALIVNQIDWQALIEREKENRAKAKMVEASKTDISNEKGERDDDFEKANKE